MRVAQGRDAVLAAAIENFTARGYHGTSMRDIAGSAGLSPAAIYHHFDSKQAILQAVMVAAMTDVIAATRSALIAADPGPAAQLEAVMGAWVLFHTTRQADALIGASELRSLDAEGRRIVVALRDEQETVFRDIIVRGVELGEFAIPHPREAARAVINMGYSIASWYRADGPVGPAEMADRYRLLARATVMDRSLVATGPR